MFPGAPPTIVFYLGQTLSRRRSAATAALNRLDLHPLGRQEGTVDRWVDIGFNFSVSVR
jgi:hypothetical protein